MAIELNGLSETELKRLRTRVDRALATLEKRRFDEARRAAEEAARAHGFSLSQVATAGTGKRPAGVPKYANPANPSQTWTGRGRQPGWLKEALAAGRKLEDLAI